MQFTLAGFRCGCDNLGGQTTIPSGTFEAMQRKCERRVTLGKRYDTHDIPGLASLIESVITEVARSSVDNNSDLDYPDFFALGVDSEGGVYFRVRGDGTYEIF